MSPEPLRVRRRKVKNVLEGDPWVYPNACIDPLPEAGFRPVVDATDDRILGWADVNPVAPVRARLLERSATEPDLTTLIGNRLDAAIQRRHRLGFHVSAGGGVRLVNGEGDGLPGLVIDSYGRHLVVDLFSRGMRDRLPLLRELLNSRLADAEILVRMGEDAARREGCDPIDPPSRSIDFAESGVHYQVLLDRGQKTGFFLDQRDNRRLVAGWARDCRVLDLFCYHGAFSLAALGGGAESALAVDSSAAALQQAQANARLNDQHLDVLQGNIFKLGDELAERGPFDLIICDPPKLAPAKADRRKALGAYRYLCDRCCRLLADNGILVVASCSQAIDADDLLLLLKQLAAKHGWHLDVVAVGTQPSDHPWPVGFATGRYLSSVAVSRRPT